MGDDVYAPSEAVGSVEVSLRASQVRRTTRPPAMDPQTGRPFGVVYNSHWLREARNRNRMSS